MIAKGANHQSDRRWPNTRTLCAAVAVLWLLALAVACPAQGRKRSAMLYVSTHGNDGWSGRLADPNATRTDGPFATLARATTALRELKRRSALPPDGTTVVVRGGTYEQRRTWSLGAKDSGTAGAPITYRAAPGEEVRLTGGHTVPSAAFSRVKDPVLLQRLVPAARGNVFQADLKAQGIPIPAAPPAKYRGAVPGPELFVNDQRMSLACWPNEGWATIANIVDTGSRPRDGDNSNRPGVFQYAGDAPARWNAATGVWLQGYWCYDWYEETIQVGAIDATQRRITLATPSLYSVMQGNPSPRHWRALNLLEELDRPGEYYVDRAAGLLYLWPPSDIARARVVLSTLVGPVVALTDASYVTLRGFTVEACQGDAITITGGTSDRVQACTMRNVTQIGVRVSGGTGHSVEACDIYDTGAGGLAMAGGDRRTLTPAGHQALNNHNHDYSRLQYTYANAIVLEGVGNRAAHNLIHGAPHQAIGIGGNDHIFEYNVVHDICTQTDDCGAYYKGRNPSARGNIVRYNFWHNIGSPMGHGNAAIYFDDGDGGDTVFGNIFFRCGEPGRGSFGTIFSHGGHGIRADNNIFVECKRALGSAPWDDARWKDAINGGQDCFWTDRLLKEVDITKPPYTTHYPELVGFMDPQPGQPRVSEAARNVMVRCGEVKSGNWQVPAADNWVTDADPGFVNAAHGDFRLRPDAEIYRRLPGFEPIPFEKMGLVADELRPTLPREPWTCGTLAPTK